LSSLRRVVLYGRRDGHDDVYRNLAKSPKTYKLIVNFVCGGVNLHDFAYVNTRRTRFFNNLRCLLYFLVPLVAHKKYLECKLNIIL